MNQHKATHFDHFMDSLISEGPAVHLSPELQALWHAKNGNWDLAHDLVQDSPSKEAAWVHGWLHWQEGDLWNADYWYRRAGKTRPSNLDAAWQAMVMELLPT